MLKTKQLLKKERKKKVEGWGSPRLDELQPENINSLKNKIKKYCFHSDHDDGTVCNANCTFSIYTKVVS